MVRSTDRPAMTIAVDLGRKAIKQTNNNSILIHLYNIFFYKMIIMWKSCNGPNFFITANSL